LISILAKDEESLLAKGAAEVDEMASGRGPEITEAAAPAAAKPIPTIGNLKNNG